MLTFRSPRPEDKAWIDPLLQGADSRACEYNFTNLLIWSQAYQMEIAQWEGFLLTRLCGSLDCSYLYPIGAGDPTAAVLALAEDARAQGFPLQLVCLTAEQTEQLQALFPGRFQYIPDRDGYDYLYEVDRLADLPGKKLHAKRNHINRFMENNPTWVYEPLTKTRLAECLEMDREWYYRSLKEGDVPQERELGPEGTALLSAVANYEALGLEGGLIRVYGEVVAFTLGEPLCSDTYVVHFEKAYGELQGAYAMINREFARQVRQVHPDIRYLNREDDMGVEGLRKAKESYYPDLMVEKYTAVLQD